MGADVSRETIDALTADKINRLNRHEAWQFLANVPFRRLDATNSTERSKLAAKAAFGSPRGLTYYATLFGRPVPNVVSEALVRAIDALRSSDELVALVGDRAAFLGDLYAYGTPGGGTASLDEALLVALTATLGDFVAARSVNESLLSVAKPSPLIDVGLASLDQFYHATLEGTIRRDAGWTWADTALVALIVHTSVHWDQRLLHVFGRRLSQATVSRLGTYWMDVVASPQPHSVNGDGALVLTTLHAVAVDIPVVG